MAKVIVLFLGHLKDLVKSEKIEICIENGITVKKLLEEKLKNFNELKKELLTNGNTHLINIMVNGKGIYSLNGLNTKLKDKDIVVLMPAILGGIY